jgi:hypothetical protein
MAEVVTAGRGGFRGWQRWAPYAAVAWSTVYAALGGYWMVSGRGFPFDSKPGSDALASVVGQLGPGAAWIVVLAAGLPAAVVGTLMLRGVRRLRLLLMAAGALLAVILLLLMADINLLVMVGYIPYVVVRLFTGGEFGRTYLAAVTQWTFLHQWLCVIGGFVWLAATVSYSRQSGEACLACGRSDGPEGWTSPAYAARWGRIAVYVALVAPIVYGLTRYAWAVGIPLGMNVEQLRLGQERGTWISGLFLANFGLVGAALMLGLVQRWGEVFPRWMIGLAGRRVPIVLAVVPAAIVSVLLMVGGLTICSNFPQMAESAAASGQNVWIVVGPTLLFPVWGSALAVATLGYYYRRRGPCGRCGRGVPGSASEARTSLARPAGRLPAAG